MLATLVNIVEDEAEDSVNNSDIELDSELEPNSDNSDDERIEPSVQAEVALEVSTNEDPLMTTTVMQSSDSNYNIITNAVASTMAVAHINLATTLVYDDLLPQELNFVTSAAHARGGVERTMGVMLLL
ncbi:hypothetical protein ACH5RR_026510 [Cinchona calisaya]|uniref:Uncharacterized protein n=1 Tax=Cinchona calisaya TaxID=153742 RepID=A0ABD2Z2R8_9GENT